MELVAFLPGGLHAGDLAALRASTFPVCICKPHTDIYSEQRGNNCETLLIPVCILVGLLPSTKLPDHTSIVLVGFAPFREPPR